nr:hypothetical protein CFP56_30993 [Quercus suber]
MEKKKRKSVASNLAQRCLRVNIHATVSTVVENDSLPSLPSIRPPWKSTSDATSIRVELQDRLRAHSDALKISFLDPDGRLNYVMITDEFKLWS